MAAPDHSAPPSGTGSGAPSESGDPQSPNPDHVSDDRKLSRGLGKRNRVHFACTECYRRKQKCNRETPCQHCIARKIPERCRTFQPGEDANDVGSRLSRVEKLLDDYLPALLQGLENVASITATGQPSSAGLKRRGSEAPPYATSPLGIHFGSETETKGSFRQSGTGIGTSVEAAESDDDLAGEQDTLSPKTGTLIGGSAMEMHLGTLLGNLPGKKPSPTFREPVRTVDSVSEIDEIMCEYGAPIGFSARLLSALPDRPLCNTLLDHYFDQVNWIRQPLPKRSLLASFDKFWDMGPKVTLENLNIFSIICSLCAISCLSVEDPRVPDDARTRILAARRYHFAAKRSLALSSMVGREDLDHIVGAVLSCRFLLLDRRIGEAYSSSASVVRAAHTIGLHRDGTKLGLNGIETEMRRRVWASVYFLDRLLSLTTGRPPAIDDRITDTLAPSREVDGDVYPMPVDPPKLPPGVEPPTPMSYTIFRHQIALIEGRILSGLQSVDHPLHVGGVLAIDREIQELQNGLPFYLRAKATPGGVECDRSLDSAYGFLAVQRFLVHTEISSVRIALHRPFLLRASSTARYLPCRKACLDAAIHDLELRNDFSKKASLLPQTQVSAYRIHIGTFKWFHSLLICGIVLLMEPEAHNAPQLRGYLQHFVDSYYGRPQAMADEMRTREANVIELFLSKHDELQQKGGRGTKAAGRKRVRKQNSIDESLKHPRGDPSASSRSQIASTSEMGKQHHRSATARSVQDFGMNEADGDEHATADLLLGLGQQGRQTQRSGGRRTESDATGPSDNAGGRPSTTAASYAGLVNRGNHSPANLMATQSPYRQESGEWVRSYSGIKGGGGGGVGSAGNSPLGTPNTNALRGDRSTVPSPITADSSGVGASTNGNASGDDAQSIFDSWYRAEFAAASMPSYDAPYAEGGLAPIPYGMGMQMPAASAFGLGGAFGAGFQMQGQPAYPHNLGPSQMLQQAQTSTNTSAAWGMGSVGGLNSRAGPSLSAMHQSYRSSSDNKDGDGYVGPSGSSGPPQSYTSNQSLSSAKGGGGIVAGAVGSYAPGLEVGAGSGTGAGATSSSSATGAAVTMQPHAAGLNAWQPAGPQDAANTNFDPAFWQTLIDKIVT